MSTMKELLQKATPGSWSVPHFADDSCKCDCRYVLCETCFGAICTIHLANDKPISEGGNDDPPLEQAKANAQLIARCNPQTMALVLEALESWKAALMCAIRFHEKEGSPLLLGSADAQLVQVNAALHALNNSSP